MEKNKLQHLNISNNNIADDGVMQIAEGLGYNTTLTDFYAQRCNFSVKGNNIASYYMHS